MKFRGGSSVREECTLELLSPTPCSFHEVLHEDDVSDGEAEKKAMTSIRA